MKKVKPSVFVGAAGLIGKWRFSCLALSKVATGRAGDGCPERSLWVRMHKPRGVRGSEAWWTCGGQPAVLGLENVDQDARIVERKQLLLEAALCLEAQGFA